MSRLRFVAPLAAVLALAASGVAQASSNVHKVTGGTATVTLSSAAQSVLTNNHITVTQTGGGQNYSDPLASPTYSFTITGGRVNVKNYNGYLHLKGGLTFSNGSKSYSISGLYVAKSGAKVGIFASVRHRARFCVTHGTRRHHTTICVVRTRVRYLEVAKITNGKVSGSTATGTLRLTSVSADAINDLAGKHVAKAGDAFGTGSATPTF